MKLLKYQIVTRTNMGTAEHPDIVRTYHEVEIRCEDEQLDTNLAIAKVESCNGEVTVEDVPLNAEEARAKRDKLLADTDWTQVLDAPIDAATREAYRVYRKALRDIPEQEGFPAAITWPDLPAVVKADPDPVDTAVDTMLGGETA